MMDAQKVERMYEIAERVAARLPIERTIFGEHASPSDYSLKDVIPILTEGRLRGQRFASWMPVSGATYRDESLHEQLIKRSRDVWRFHARNDIFRLDMIVGPKGKLPA